MPVMTRMLRVFLSSPGDVGEQRKIVHSVIAEINADPLRRWVQEPECG